MVYSDKSRVCLDCPDHWEHVWRHCRECFHNNCIQEVDRGIGASIMVWAGVTYHDWIPLVIVDCNLNATCYINEILQPIIILFLDQHSEIRFFQQDNTRVQSEQLTTAFLDGNDIRVLDGHHIPPTSPPLSTCGTSWRAPYPAATLPPKIAKDSLLPPWRNGKTSCKPASRLLSTACSGDALRRSVEGTHTQYWICDIWVWPCLVWFTINPPKIKILLSFFSA